MSKTGYVDLEVGWQEAVPVTKPTYARPVVWVGDPLPLWTASVGSRVQSRLLTCSTPAPDYWCDWGGKEPKPSTGDVWVRAAFQHQCSLLSMGQAWELVSSLGRTLLVLSVPQDSSCSVQEWSGTARPAIWLALCPHPGPVGGGWLTGEGHFPRPAAWSGRALRVKGLVKAFWLSNQLR